jgi:hypothetical protein
VDGIENALTTNGMTEEYGRRGLRSKAPNNSGVTVSCDLGAEPGLRNSESRAISRNRDRPSLFMILVTEIRLCCQLRSDKPV